MDRVRPLLRASIVALPLLTGACASDAPSRAVRQDDSCLLLCALTRAIMDEPAPATPQPATLPPRASRPAASLRAARSKPVSALVAKPSVPEIAKARAPEPQPRASAPVHPRPRHRKPSTDVSVMPQSPTGVAAPKPVAIVPSAPAPVAVAPPAPQQPATSLSQTIPGSAGIMAPTWQGH